MILLQPYEYKFIVPAPVVEWRTPSQAIEKDTFGNDGYRVRFTIKYILNDGYVRWSGVFESREDFDAFLWAIATDTLSTQPSLWDLPTPSWAPGVEEGAIVQHFTTISHTSGVGAETSYSLPSDWNSTTNTVNLVGGGGSGGILRAGITGGPGHATGGGGGQFSRLDNFSNAPFSTYWVGLAAGGAAWGPGSNSVGQAGGTTYLRNSAYTTVASAGGGGAGQRSTGSTANGGTGGSGGTGTVTYAGGRGGNGTGTGSSDFAGTGGGGSGGASGVGGNGGDSTGGGGVETGGGAAGAGGYGGAGGQGRYRYNNGSVAVGGNLWGAGGGGASVESNSSGNQATSGAGAQGILELIYTPPKRSGYNIAMMGM